MTLTTQRYITKALINTRGTERFDCCLRKVSYWGHDEEMFDIHKLMEEACPMLVVRSYVVNKKDGKPPIVRRVH